MYHIHNYHFDNAYGKYWYFKNKKMIETNNFLHISMKNLHRFRQKCIVVIIK
jgi:hypothetical protein